METSQGKSMKNRTRSKQQRLRRNKEGRKEAWMWKKAGIKEKWEKEEGKKVMSYLSFILKKKHPRATSKKLTHV